MADNIPQMGKAYTWYFPMKDATDGFTPETGKAPTVTASKNGAAFAALTGAPAVSEIAEGWYKVIVPAVDMVASVLLNAAAAGCVDTNERILPEGDAYAVLTGKKVFSRSAMSVSVKAPDATTEQLSITYANIDNDSFSWSQ